MITMTVKKNGDGLTLVQFTKGTDTVSLLSKQGIVTLPCTIHVEWDVAGVKVLPTAKRFGDLLFGLRDQ